MPKELKLLDTVNLDYKTRLKSIVTHENFEEVVKSHICNGGTVITLAEIWDVKSSDVFSYLFADSDRRQRYNDWLLARSEWEKEKILDEIRQIGTASLKEIFNDDHTLKPISEWPEACVKALAGIEIQELFDFQDGEKDKVGEVKKIKMLDKLRALELLGKQQGMFAQKHEIHGKMTLEMLVMGSMKDAAIDVPVATPELNAEKEKL